MSGFKGFIVLGLWVFMVSAFQGLGCRVMGLGL